MKRTAAADYSTEGLLGELLGIATSTNDILASINSLELEIHEAKANGDPVSTGANAVISLLDNVRGHYSDALDVIISRMDVLSGKTTPKPRPEEVAEEDVEELPEE